MFNVPSFYGFNSSSSGLPFEFTINTANLSTGSSTATQFKLPLTTSTGLDCFVYWGDGTYNRITSHTAPEITHTYASSGAYTVKITGKLLGWQFNNTGDRLKMLDVIKWSGLNISTDFGFYGCTNMTCTATDAPLITGTSLREYFRECPNFNGQIGNWNVSQVQNMRGMFQGVLGGTRNIFNRYIGDWNTSSVTDMSFMFDWCSFNQNISTKVVTVNGNTYTAWDMSNVINISIMFRGNLIFNQPIENWNTSNIQGMFGVFNSANSFNRPIEIWDTSSVTNMGQMFQANTIFNRPIGIWDVSSVTEMREMFNGNSVFNQDIGSWNVSNVTDMSRMFSNSSAFNQDIGGWNVSNVTNFSNFMAAKTAANYSAANLDSIYNGWSSRPVKPNLSITFGTIKYTAAGQAGKDILDNAPNNWTIVDGGI
jgi:surface protein